MERCAFCLCLLLALLLGTALADELVIPDGITAIEARRLRAAPA